MYFFVVLIKTERIFTRSNNESEIYTSLDSYSFTTGKYMHIFLSLSLSLSPPLILCSLSLLSLYSCGDSFSPHSNCSLSHTLTCNNSQTHTQQNNTHNHSHTHTQITASFHRDLDIVAKYLKDAYGADTKVQNLWV